MPDSQKDIIRLRAEIAEHDRLYYKDAQPKIDDQAYDRLKLELAELEAAMPEFDFDASPLSPWAMIDSTASIAISTASPCLASIILTVPTN